MSDPPRIERLIIGSGPAAAAAAMAFRKRSAPFEVIDIGFDLEPERRAKLEQLAELAPDAWAPADRDFLFPKPVASTKGVERRLAFGSDYPYRIAAGSTLATEDCSVEVSHGLGGFGNVWGAAMLPWSATDTSTWPVPRAELERSFGEVLEFVPISGEQDRLAEAFPPFTSRMGRLPRTPQAERLLSYLEGRAERLAREGVAFGRARVAVDSSGGTTTCRRCAQCLDGCVYGSIFNPQAVWRRLEGEGVTVRRGLRAVSFQEDADGVRVRFRPAAGGPEQVVQAARVFLGLGAVGSTRLTARSLGLTGRPIEMLDSQYFFFPFLSWRAAETEPIEFTLAELFVEVLHRELGPNYVHFQVYGLNQIFRDTLAAMLPGPLRRPALLRLLERRFYLFQGFLPSQRSGRLALTVEPGPDGDDRASIRGIPNPDAARTASRAQALLRRQLLGLGLVPPLPPKMVAIGRSFHLGGSFPMGGGDPTFRSDLAGRPASARRVHLLDGATFPTVPASTVTLTIMANANRVARESLRLED